MNLHKPHDPAFHLRANRKLTAESLLPFEAHRDPRPGGNVRAWGRSLVAGHTTAHDFEIQIAFLGQFHRRT